MQTYGAGTMKITRNNRPKLQLTGNSGNAYYIIGAAAQAYRRHYGNETSGPVEWDVIRKEMESGNYDHLLITTFKHFDVD